MQDAVLRQAPQERAADAVASVGIVGAGWLGLPLAHALSDEGWAVTVTVTRQEKVRVLRAEGLNACQLHLSAQMGSVWPLVVDNLVVCVPPGKMDDYPGAITQLCTMARAAGVRNLLFVSATSVWGPGQGEEEQAAPHTERGLRMLAAERAVLAAGFDRAIVVRPAGLYGPGRHPGRFLAGKSVSGGAQAVNLVHQQDLVAACCLLLEQGESGACYTLSAPGHPSRQEFYRAAAVRIGLVAPDFIEPAGDFSPVTGARICRELGFEYWVADPLAWLASEAGARL
ncbi:NAD-dependent epimerase/dehydratase family protein [Aeromonas rivuli]|uniref:NAD-dependent epimerase/dehydratase family protein n=1 Tax=Aeromonas rivuli TaxID=648794 RepID=UPI001CCA454E|nr:NAD-dependent epimerase/dehydratase family protein [Aeromonas rivuli]UBO75384.1 NAD-dependent epimerase/dehydratase family protein [Aeromonas rivuli]